MPTASQSSAEAQEIPVSETSAPPAGSGMDWTTQAVPFHASASAVVPELPAWEPTASQEAAAVHDTAARPEELAPAGIGAACSFQAVPFQLSASGAVTPAVLR